MKLSKVIFHIGFVLVFGLSVGGCTFPVTESDDFDIHFVRPGNGDVIMVGESFQLAARGSSTAGEVSRILYFANGVLIGEELDRIAGTNILADHMWTPTEPGQYTLQLAAQRGSEYAYSSTVNVCVLPFQIAPGHPFDIYAHGYEGDCVIPERASSVLSGEPTTETASASPDPLTYVPTIYYEDSCGDETRFVNFKFYVNDPSDDIVFAAIAISMNPAYFGRISGETTLALTNIGTRAPNTKMFAGGMNLHIFLERSFSIPETGEGESGELEWSARGFSRSGEILLEAGPFIIPVTPVSCDGSLPIIPIVTFPVPTFASEAQLIPTFSIPSIPSIFTLSRDAVCRAGPSLDYKIAEYLSNGVKVPVQARSADSIWLVVLLPNGVRCWVSSQLGTLDGDPNLLPVEDAPPIIATATQSEQGQPNETSVVCSQYTTDNSCNAAGCSYNYVTKTCE